MELRRRVLEPAGGAPAGLEEPSAPCHLKVTWPAAVDIRNQIGGFLIACAVLGVVWYDRLVF